MQKQIESIAIDRLAAHPANPNVMSNSSFKKLCSHIKASGNYEPVIVRPKQNEADSFEILNGHHRTKALKKLGYEKADCIVWDDDDDKALVLLGTLNRLSGSDQLDKKSELIKQLSKSFDSRELAKLLPETKKSIERLQSLGAAAKTDYVHQKAFLNPVVFFLTDKQKRTVDEVIAVAIDPGLAATTPQKRAWTIVKILREAKCK